jgi:hypothetical protein
MKNKIHIKAVVLLVGILFSFSLSAYSSLNNLRHEGYFSIKKIRVDIPKEDRCSNDILSEELENENDNDDLLSETSFVLPFSGLSLDIFPGKIPVSRYIAVQDSPESIWLSIRVFRI